MTDKITFWVGLLAALFAITIFILHRKKKAHSQKLETLGLLAGEFAHDFNNILTGMRGAAEILDTKIPENDSLHKYVKIILTACEQSAGLCGRILNYTRSKEEAFSSCSLHKSIQDAAELLSFGLDKKISLNLSLTAANEWINAREEMLTDLILNLAINAKNAIKGQGQINIATQNLTLTKDLLKHCLIKAAPGAYTELCISDSGCGIPTDIRKNIFKPFCTSGESGKGCGLGLAAVYDITRQLGGTLCFESSAVGTTFHIYFPQAAKRQPVNDTPAVKPLSASKNFSVLIIDDDPILLELLKEMLLLLKVVPLTAPNAETALKISRTQILDIAMIDLVLPDSSAVKLYTTLRQEHPDIKIIFMSGGTPDDEIQTILTQDSNTGFLPKPCSLEELQKLFRC